MNLTKRYEQFNNREERAAFIAKTFQQEISEPTSILDVSLQNYLTRKNLLLI